MLYMRSLCAASRECTPHELMTATDAIFNMIHVDVGARDDGGAVIMNEGTLSSYLSKNGLAMDKAEACVAAAATAEVKALLKSNTSEALEFGAFGSPYIVITGHGNTSHADEILVFGSDRFEQVAWALRKPWFGPESVTLARIRACPTITQPHLLLRDSKTLPPQRYDCEFIV